MEKSDSRVSGLSRKRKLQDQGGVDGALSLDMLDQDLLETVLSRLPASAFFRLTSVCKRWKSLSGSASFRLACAEVPSRDPWFLMVGSTARHDVSVVFDSAEQKWKQLNRPTLLCQKPDSIPVASSGGLVCYRGAQKGDFTVCNPLTGSVREVPRPGLPCDSQSLHAIVMWSRPKPDHSFELVLVYGEFPRLFFKAFDSSLDTWGAEVALSRSAGSSDSDPDSDSDFLELNYEAESVYFLSKAGNVVAPDMLRSPSKQYSSVIVERDGSAIVYFLSSSGTVVGCNMATRSFFEYPRLLPFCSEYSIDVMECRGELAVAVLSDFLETASLRIWKFDEESQSWVQLAAMPPSISHEFYGKKMDINCVGLNGRVLICLNSGEVFRYVTYDLAADEWLEVPPCRVNDIDLELSSAFSFEPRIEASL